MHDDLKQINDDFLNKIDKTARFGIGAFLILQFGFIQHKKISEQYPDSPFMVGSGHPNDPNARKIKYVSTHREISQVISDNRGILLELVLTEIVQHWYDFMSELFRFAVREKLAGNQFYKVAKCQPKIDLSKFNSKNLYKLLEDACVEEFDFEKSSNKLKKLRKLFQVDLTAFDEDLNVIKKFVFIRNLLQHNHGVIREEDLLGLGTNAIVLDDGKKNHNYSVGERIKLSVFDINEFTDSLIKISQALLKTM